MTAALTPLVRLALATEMLLNARWALDEELGLFDRSEDEAASGALGAIAEALNDASERLGELNRERGVGTAAAEGTADRLIEQLLPALSALVDGAGTQAAERSYLAACSRALDELAQAATAASDGELSQLLERPLRALEPCRNAGSADHVAGLLRLWRACASPRGEERAR